MKHGQPNTMADSYTRRQLLRRGGTASLLASVTAGCVETLPPLGSRIQLGRVDVPSAGPPVYRSWVPAPSAAQEELSFDPEQVLQARPADIDPDSSYGVASFAHQTIKSKLDWFGYGYETYERAIMIDDGIVLLGRIDPSVVAETLSKTQYASAGRYGEYTLFNRSDIPRTVAVRDDVIVWAQDTAGWEEGDDSRQIVESIIDAGDDHTTRYHEINRDFDLLTSASGDRPANWIGPTRIDPTDEAVLGSASTAFDERGFYIIEHLIYPSEDAVPVREIERSLAANERVLDAERIDVQARGRLVSIEQWYGDGSPPDRSHVHWPQITWGAEYDESANRITLSHEVGETVKSKFLTVKLLTGDADTPAKSQFADEYERVQPGNQLTLDLSEEPPRQVTIEYEPSERQRSLLMNYYVA